MMNLRHVLLASVLMLSACEPGMIPVQESSPAPSASPSAAPSASPSAAPTASPSAAPALPEAADVATLDGVKATSCADEGTLRSATSRTPTQMQFTNNAEGSVTIYWLNQQGTRVRYKTLATGESHTQDTYVTHPWLIANAQDQCLAIYLPEEDGTVSVDINKTEIAG